MRNLLLVLCFIGAAVMADSVKLRNGQAYEGTVKYVGKIVTVIQGDAVFQFKISEVAEMNGKTIEQEKNPIIRIATSMGDIYAELFEDAAPNTVANMIQLAESGFYNGMAFHRVIPGFMAQGGCPNSKRGATGTPGTGGPGYTFDNETDTGLKHDGKGILSMANSGADTNGSQFFICFTETPWLNGKHTVFGKVTQGLDVLDKIEKIGTQSGKTKEDVRFNIEVVSKRDHEYKVKKN